MPKSAKARGYIAGANRVEDPLTQTDGMSDFEERLKRARNRRVIASDGKARGSALSAAFRITTELIAGVVVGGLIGWQLDKWLETSPVFLLVFFLLGAAAGIWNVIRTAWKMQSKAHRAETDDKEPGPTRDE